MSPIIIFSLTFNLIGTVAITYFAYKIMRLEVTPTWTWSLKCAAAVISVIQVLWLALFVSDISIFIDQFAPWKIAVTYFLDTLRTGLVLAFAARVYFTLRAKFPWHIKL